MRILVACEFSGVVRDAFIAQGHDAISCDLLPSNQPGPHIEGNVLDHLVNGYDMLLAFPPCTYLCNSGVRWLYKKGRKENGLNQERWFEMEKAAEFFQRLWNAPIGKICIENPVPHRYAELPFFNQSIQPWQFGHGEVKRTCFWLKNLPLLRPTKIVEGRYPRVHYASPSIDRWKKRSITLPGIALAMAEQWRKT